jgi:hypothetical protein
MIRRVFKIFGLVWITGWLLTWAFDIKAEYEHSEEYSIILPTGETHFDTGRFAYAMIEHGVLLFLFWPDAVYIEVGCRTGVCPLNYN